MQPNTGTKFFLKKTCSHFNWSMISEFYLECHETFRPDLVLMYQSQFRQNLKPYIETKLPESLVVTPWVMPAPISWCMCEDDMDCPVHGDCDQCEQRNSVCDCDWWYDEHFCNTCG